MSEWLQVVIRSLSLIIVLFIFTKFFRKKSIDQFTLFEYMTAIVIGGIVAAFSILPSLNFTFGLIALFLWFIIPYLSNIIALKSKRFRDLTLGKSTVFIKEGKIMEDNLKKAGYSTDDLLIQLRRNQIFQFDDVEFALLEPTGELNVLPKKEAQTLTAKSLGIQIPNQRHPETVIMDGEMLLESLANRSLNPNWLETELDKMNVSIENVFLAQVDGDGQLTVDLYDDKIMVPQPTEKPLLLATLKKAQADLELFSLATENEQSKYMYEINSKKLQKAITILNPYVK